MSGLQPHARLHVLAELEAYAPLTTLHSYCIVFDTIMEDYRQNSSRTDRGDPETIPRPRYGNTLGVVRSSRSTKTSTTSY